jgi:hypothetical protein
MNTPKHHPAAEHVKDRWLGFGNKLPPDALGVWDSIADVFDKHLNGQAECWSVMPAETGAGKSLSATSYAALLAKDPKEHRGMLIVSRLMSQVDEMIETINTIATAHVAVGRHSESNTTRESEANAQILCITHAMFNVSLSQLENGEGKRWRELMIMEDGQERSLIVVDESLDMLKLPTLEVSAVNALNNVLPKLKGHDPATMIRTQTCNLTLNNTLLTMQELPSADLQMIAGVLNAQLDLAQYAKDLGTFNGLLDVAIADGASAKTKYERDRLVQFKTAKEHMEMLLHILDSFGVIKNNADRIFTGCTVLPLMGSPPVILDATANVNNVYDQLRKNGGICIDVVELKQLRRYDNLTVHVARLGKTGKSSLVSAKGQTMVTHAYDDVMFQAKKYGLTDTLVVSHKDTEPYWAKFANLRTAHFNAIDGLNVYSQCDSCVIWGFLHQDMVRMKCSMIALSAQIHNGIPDDSLATEFEARLIAAKIIQALNRIRTRRITDTDGGCAPSHAFLTIPSRGTIGDRVLDLVMGSMPGAQLQDWELDVEGPAKMGRKRNFDYHQAAVTFLKNLAVGKTVKMKHIQAGAGLSNEACKTAFQLRTRSGNDRDAVFASLREQGIQVYIDDTKTRDKYSFTRVA